MNIAFERWYTALSLTATYKYVLNLICTRTLLATDRSGERESFWLQLGFHQRPIQVPMFNSMVTQTALVKLNGSQNKTQSPDSKKGTGRDSSWDRDEREINKCGQRERILTWIKLSNNKINPFKRDKKTIRLQCNFIVRSVFPVGPWHLAVVTLSLLSLRTAHKPLQEVLGQQIYND